MSSPERGFRMRRSVAVACVVLVGVGLPVSASANFPAWLQHLVGASTAESALYRVMQLPAVQALYPRPPKEAAGELSKRIETSAANAELYELRARAEEQALDETAAEADWKLYVAHAPDAMSAQLELADFYERRLMSQQEIAVLGEVAAAPMMPSEKYLDPSKQRSWMAFERILGTLYRQGLPSSQTASTFDAFLARYPDQPAVYAAAFQFQLEQRNWAEAERLLERYARQFPHDSIFPVRARALLEYRRGNVDAALAVYDHAFEPLWPAELVQSYLALLDQTHRQRAFVAAAREQLAAHPDGPEALNALARIFDYDQQAGRLDSARQTLAAFRIAREASKTPWTAADLATLAALNDGIHDYAESARYDYALASTEGAAPNGEPAAQQGLASLVGTLLEAPDEPLAVGARTLTLYRDIATLDQGPGYWNGILSLWLNGTQPGQEYRDETAKAQGYFHRAKAAELLADLDRRFPAAPERPRLHAELIRALAQYGEPATVVAAGKEFLAAFHAAPERLDVVNLLADAYAREKDTADEFALYEAQLSELAAKTDGLPLTSSGAMAAPPVPGTVDFYVRVQDPDSVDSTAGPAQKLNSQPLAAAPARAWLPEGAAYASLLDRYLGRLIATGQLPRALTVLRHQIDRNPSDPQLYERAASFLQQNNLSGPQEQVYAQAIAKFQQPTYYDKLARLYLREKKAEAFAGVTRQVTGIFSGSELEGFFASVNPGEPIGPQLALELNLYAAKRYPHDLVFTKNLLAAYQATPTRDPAAYEALLRHHWWESDDLRDEFLTYLSRTGTLDAELAQLEAMNAKSASDPAALREQAEIDVFASHYEQAAPLLGAVADLYPADADTGDRAVSLYRSLAYLDPTSASTHRAVALEQNLLAFAPDSPERLGTLGDLYAEATGEGGEDLASAAPYWRCIPELHPGSSQGFLSASTIFWDYFQFDAALAQINAARTRLHSAALFGYEAGAIEENRHDLPAAVDEYTNAVIHPVEIPRHFDSAIGAIAAWLKPPSDAANSSFRSTTQSFFGSEEAHARLVELATREATKASVDAATAKAVAENPSNTAALALRADVLAVSHPAAELAPLSALFRQSLERAATLDEAAAIGDLSQTRGLTPVYEQALGKQAALTPDPVQKIELEYTLARSLESRGDVAGAARVMESVRAANPRVLGVVRATTDFYGRVNQPPRAIATLLDAARLATPTLARDFTLEAAGRANDASDTAQARTLAMGLLVQTPYDARVLDVVATSYARAHDDAGLKAFYLARLDAVRGAAGLTADERKADTALLRRGLIPALTRLNDEAGAITQYTLLLSAYPEDANLGREAALYALKHRSQPQLLEFLRTTVKQSPRDSRFMVLLGSTEATFNDLPAAEAAYSQAIEIRKDRVDLYTARAEIEMRLGQSDPAQLERAAADDARLYLLSYHDPAWMVRVAELRARQQRPADAVKALQTAYLEGHAKTAADDFRVAAQLERWSLLPEARSFAEQGAALAGGKLLTASSTDAYSSEESGAVTYARILVRAGQTAEALTTLTAARRAAEVSATSPSVLAKELARENISDDEAAEFRKNFATQRRQAADQGLRAAIDAMGEAVQTYDTPEQKQALALLLDRLHASAQAGSNPTLALRLAAAAGLVDREAAWRKQHLAGAKPNASDEEAYVALERSRLQFSELAHVLEGYAARLVPAKRNAVLTQAAQAFRDAGDAANETRVERPLAMAENSPLRDRLFDLLLRRDPAALLALAANQNGKFADAVVNYTVAHGTREQALAAVANRGRALDPVWRSASASLVETYFAGADAGAVDVSDFNQALGAEATIASRVAAPVDRKRQLAGDVFFSYASRYGIFLASAPQDARMLPSAEDFLAAGLEGSPGVAASYLDLARTYEEAGNINGALAEYQHALELSPSDVAIEDEIATVLERAHRGGEALAHWQKALAILAGMQRRGLYPESWFTTFETVARHLGERRLGAACRPAIESILGPYLTKNGGYRSNELLQAAFESAATPAEGASVILAVSSSAKDAGEILEGLRGVPWLDDAAREPILLRQIELARNRPDASPGAFSYQTQLIDLYLKQNRTAQAQAVYATLSAKETDDGQDMNGVILAVRTGHLESLLAKWRANPDTVPRSSLGSTIRRLLKPTPAYKPDLAAIRPLQEFVFEDKRQNDSLAPTDFLAVAQLRLDTNDLAGSLDALHQLTLAPPSSDETTAALSSDPGDPESSDSEPTTTVSDTLARDPYRNTDDAASLLEKNHRPAEALPFLRALVQSVPWNPSYRLRLAQAEIAANARDAANTDLLSVAKNPAAPYALRAQAAHLLASAAAPATELGSGELTFLAHPTTAAAARQPYFAEARLAAAGKPGPEREQLLREAIAINPASPSSGDARLQLLLLEPPTGDPGITLAILRSIPTARASESTESDAPAAIRLPTPSDTLDQPTKIRLASAIASAFERDGDLDSALAYAEAAVTLSKSSPQPALAHRRDELKTALQLTRRNLGRSPNLRPELEQSIPVRPRLTASTLPPEER